MDVFKELNEIILEYKCSICENVLSVAPITIVTIGEELSLRCGRCKDIECNYSFYRCPFYEDILKCLSFPCIYENCDKMIVWKDVEEHEKNCEYRTVTCPLFYQECNEVVQLSKLEEHFAKEHDSNMDRDYFSFDVGYTCHFAALAIVDNEKFFLYVIIDTNYTMSISVFSLSSSKIFTKFNTTFTDGIDDTFSVSYNNQEIISYDERKCCFKCFIGNDQCPAKHHPNSTVYSSSKNNNSSNVTLSVRVKDFFEKPETVKVTVNFVSDKQQNRKGIRRETTEATTSNYYQNVKLNEANCRSNNVIRQTTECPICNELMLAPIYSCKIGHVMCNSCTTALKICPYCKENITNARCFVLERMIENLEIPCLYDKNGCSFVGKLENVRIHEVECELKYDES